jgi:2-oxoisovalerate dehydrogenase E1 component
MTTASVGLSSAISAPSVKAWEQAFLIRSFESRLLKLFSEGKLFGTVHTCIGQEFTGIAVAQHLLDGDVIVSNHRCHGHYLARTGDVNGLMAEVMGRTTGICGGRGGSQHICASGVFSNGVQGGMLPVAGGMALAKKLSGSKNIAVAFIGDGTLGEGVVYETMNLASKWELPLLIVCESNGVSQSTSQPQTLAGDIRKRAESFGIATFQSNTWKPDELSAVVASAVYGIRERSSPAFVLIDTYRLMAHSKGDDDRPKEELAHYWSIDPLTRFEAEQPEIALELTTRCEELVSEAVEMASKAPFTSLARKEKPRPETPRWKQTEIEGKDRVVNRIHQALLHQLSVDERLFLLGEDIEGNYGGAFKVTKDLSLKFPARVRNTPISEAVIIGIGNGLALAGGHPVCEIMFGDFLTLAADQIINHASKFRWMYNDQVTVPIVIRTPMGGKRGYGSTHSQCLEKHFLGLPGTRVLALHNRFDPYDIYRRLFETIDLPTLVIENKTLYGDYVSHKTIAGFWCEHTDEDFPTTRIRSNSKPDVTLVCYGSSLTEAEKALDLLFEKHEVVAEIICPTQLYPLRLEPVLESIRVSRRLLVVEEGQMFCGFGAEILAAVQESAWDLAVKARRLGAEPHPLPSCKSAELDSLPGAEAIVQASLEMMHG